MNQEILKFIKKPIFKFIFSLLILFVLLLWLPWNELWAALKKISLTAWLFVLVGFMSGHVLGAIKWRLLINMGKNKLPFWVAVQCYFAGLFSNLFLPSLAGGDIVKASVAIHYNKEKAVTIFGTFLDRIIDTASVVFIIITSAFLSPNFLQPQDQKIVYFIALFFCAIILVTGFLLAVPVEKVRHRKIRGILNRAQEIMQQVYKTPSRPITALGLSLTIQSIFILLTIYLANILDIEIPLVLWFMVWPLAKLAALLPISLGGIGVREVALAAFLGRLAVPSADSVALGLLWESVLIIGGLLGGIIYLSLNYVAPHHLPSLSSFSKQNNELKELP